MTARADARLLSSGRSACPRPAGACACLLSTARWRSACRGGVSCCLLVCHVQLKGVVFGYHLGFPSLLALPVSTLPMEHIRPTNVNAIQFHIPLLLLIH